MSSNPAITDARLRVAQARYGVENALMALDYADRELKAEGKRISKKIRQAYKRDAPVTPLPDAS